MISENIKKLRNLNKIKQVDLAKTLGISVRTLQKYESGEINPPLDKINGLASALDVSVAELIGEESFDKKVSKEIYTNMTDDELIKLLNLNEEKFKSLSLSDKEGFIEELSNIEPYKIKLQILLDNFDNITKQDLINLCNDIKQYYVSMVEKFVSDNFEPALTTIKVQSDYIQTKNEIIEKYEKILDSIVSSNNIVNSNDNK